MRIISGYLKGKKINFLKNTTTRPLKDSVKENIFNILTHSNLIKIRIEKSNVLDLYAGIGSFGIECISRGAQEVIFFERDNQAIKILKENLNLLSIISKSKLISGNVENTLINNFFNKFDIIFLDPPFNDSKFVNTLKLIKQNSLFKSNHIIVIHREIKTQDNFQNLINIVDIKEYGRSKIIFGFFN